MKDRFIRSLFGMATLQSFFRELLKVHAHINTKNICTPTIYFLNLGNSTCDIAGLPKSG